MLVFFELDPFLFREPWLSIPAKLGFSLIFFYLWSDNVFSNFRNTIFQMCVGSDLNSRVPNVLRCPWSLTTMSLVLNIEPSTRKLFIPYALLRGPLLSFLVWKYTYSYVVIQFMARRQDVNVIVGNRSANEFFFVVDLPYLTLVWFCTLPDHPSVYPFVWMRLDLC